MSNKAHKYKNPWFKSDGTRGPEYYTTDAKPAQVGKYQRFYRIQSRNPSARCYDYVLDGVCVTQRCGSGFTEAELDEYIRTADRDHLPAMRAKLEAQPNKPAAPEHTR